MSEGEDSIRGRKFERRPPSGSHRTANPDLTDPTGTKMEPSSSGPANANAKPAATSVDAGSSNNTNNSEPPTKDRTGGQGVLPEQRPSGTTGVREFKRAQQMVTRSPRSPRSPRRGFERGGDARNGPSEHATLEGSSASTATLASTTTPQTTADGQDPPKAASTLADTTLATEHSGAKQKSDPSTSSSFVNTKEGASTEAPLQSAHPETPPKKRKPARKNRKNDDEVSSTLSAGSGKDNADSATVAPTAAGQRESQVRPEASSSRAQSKEPSGVDTTTTNVKKESADGAWVPKSKATRPQPRENNGISPGYLGKNPIANYQRAHTQDSRRAPEVAHGTVSEDASSPATTETPTFTPKSKKKAPKDDTPILLQSGWGEPPEALLTSTVESGGWGESVNPTLRWGEEVTWESQIGMAPLSETDWTKNSAANASQSHSQHTHREVSDSSNARRDKFGSGDQTFSRTPRDRADYGAGRDRERADRGTGRDRPGPGRGGAVTGDARFSRPTHLSGESHQQRRVGQYQKERANGAHSLSQERPPTDTVPPKDTRSSLDKRNERLALQRGPHPEDYRAGRSDSQQQHRNDDATPTETPNKEGADDDATSHNTTRSGPGAPQTVPVETTGSVSQRPSQSKEGFSHKSADIRLDPRYNPNSDRESTGSGSSRPSYSRNGSSSTNYQQRSQSSSSLVSQDTIQQRSSAPGRSKLGSASELKLRTAQRPVNNCFLFIFGALQFSNCFHSLDT